MRKLLDVNNIMTKVGNNKIEFFYNYYKITIFLVDF